MNAPIPSFYCCYLLRSLSSPKKFYVGSTPDAKRRLKQHNGGILGGAKKTHKDRHRPWVMTCLVSGFPSRMAALQFEWAWQHPHISRHISKADRITEPIVKLTKTKRAKKQKLRVVRPMPSSLRDELGNLHLLLRARSFALWPLKVKFFTTAEYDFWKDWDAQAGLPLAVNADVSMVEAPVPAESLAGKTANAVAAIMNTAKVNSLDFSYASLKETLRHNTGLLTNIRHECAICQQEVSPASDLSLACSQSTCDMVAHLTCLSQHFLERDSSPQGLLPTTGICPACKTQLSWSALVSDLSLRLRGQPIVEKLLKSKSRTSKSKQSKPIVSEDNHSMQLDSDEDEAGPNLKDDVSLAGDSSKGYVNYQHHDRSIVTTDSDDAASVSSVEWKDIETIK